MRPRGAIRVVFRGLGSRSARAGVAVLACAALAGSAPRQPADPLVGVWELNLARTRYSPEADPRRRETFTCAPVRGGVSCTIRAVRADGRTTVGRFTAAYDGRASRVTGIPDVDQVRLRRAGERGVDATFSRQGRPVFGYQAVQSRTGESLTITSVDPVTRARLRSVVVYDRVRPGRRGSPRPERGS